LYLCSLQDPRKSSNAFIDAALAFDEPVERLGIQLEIVLCHSFAGVETLGWALVRDAA
jgi:hypothetical protein